MRERRFSGDDRGPPRGYSPRRRARSPRRNRDGDYSPRRRRKYSPPRRYPSPNRNRHYSPPLRARNRNREISPPANWESRGRSRDRERLHSPPRAEYFHDLERSRRMAADVIARDRDYDPSRDRGNPPVPNEGKYPWSHLLDEPQKFDTVKPDNPARPYPPFMDDKRTFYDSEVAVHPRIDNTTAYSRYLDVDRRKDEELHLHDGFHSRTAAGGGGTMSRRDPFVDDSFKSMRYSDFTSDYMISSSHSNVLPKLGKDDIATSYPKEVPLRAHGRLDSGKTIESIGHDGYDKNPGAMSSLNLEKQPSGLRNYSDAYFGRTKERRETYSYPDIPRGEVGSPNALSSEFYRQRVPGSGDSHFQDASRTNMGLGKYDELSHVEDLMEDKPWGSHLSSQRQPMQDYFEPPRRALDERKPNVEMFHYEANRQYERGTHRKRELPEYPMDGDLLERSDPLYRERDPRMDKIETRPRERFISRDLPGQSSVSLRENHGTPINHGTGITIPDDVRSARKIHGREDADEIRISRRTNPVAIARKLSAPRSKYGKNGRAYNSSASTRPAQKLSVSISSRSTKFSKSGRRDIKKRLGPRYQNLDMEQTTGKNYKPSLKKRLGPRVAKNHAPPPWVKASNSRKFSRNQDGLDESVAEQGDDCNEGSIATAKTEPPENSKDFKQLVQNAFFRFMKHLNETPAKRRKYREQAGSLKCLVCGRDSEEFVDLESLVLHALTSPKAGLKSPHLGLHKALCALMGWKSAGAPNDGWAREMLSNTEIVALKEDLIIWPPVVIIHNSSIMNINPDQRVVVSVEELESKLRDMGFGEKAKVARGKPANQSILMVKFSATLSGLQEAERLSDIYTHRKHGRAEFQHISCDRSESSDAETSEPLTDKVSNILYGYLGIAEDLDKLDFDTKKRSAVRSKKQIKDIAEAL